MLFSSVLNDVPELLSTLFESPYHHRGRLLGKTIGDGQLNNLCIQIGRSVDAEHHTLVAVAVGSEVLLLACKSCQRQRLEMVRWRLTVDDAGGAVREGEGGLMVEVGLAGDDVVEVGVDQVGCVLVAGRSEA